jgi:MoxR-like ATPase
MMIQDEKEHAFISLEVVDQPRALPGRGGLQPSVHVFERQSILAINAAIAAGRPLLVRGEPGTGKSQLARAAAEELGRAFVFKVVDSRTEAQDLFYTFDAVARLAEAQVAGASHRDSGTPETLIERLHERRFLSPGPLWWAFHWSSARDQAEVVAAMEPPQPQGWRAEHGCVVLLDEIDKADSSIPNGLLEALGNGAFPVPRRRPIAIGDGQAPPLVMITTNEERSLPDAFLRRCLVLHLTMPDDDSSFKNALIKRGGVHFPACPPPVLEKAAAQTAEDRKAVRMTGLAAPGQAEFLDLIRAVIGLASTESDQLTLLDQIKDFALKKHPRSAEL